MNARILLTASALAVAALSHAQSMAPQFAKISPSGGYADLVFSPLAITSGSTATSTVSSFDLILNGITTSYSNVLFTLAATSDLSGTGASDGTATAVSFSFVDSATSQLLLSGNSLFGTIHSGSLSGDNTPSDPTYQDGVQFASALFTNTDTSQNTYNFDLTNMGNGEYHAQFSAYGYVTPTAAPEPASIAALGLGGLALLRRRRRAA